MNHKQSKINKKTDNKKFLDCRFFGLLCRKCGNFKECDFRYSYKNNFGVFPEKSPILIIKELKQIKDKRLNL